MKGRLSPTCQRSEKQASWCSVHDGLYPPLAIRCNGWTPYIGDPNDLTWAVFDFPAEGHGVPGKYEAGAPIEWPADHVPDASCPCRPSVNWHSDIAPRPLYEHHAVSA